LAWEIFKYACLSFGVGLVLTAVLLNVPWTRRRILALAERLADWHDSGVNDEKRDKDWYKKSEKD
jgi:hypothetical protein